MSDHGHAATSDGHGDHHDDYLGIPADEAGPDEPATPGWLTLLGMGLVLSVMLAFLVTRPDGKTRAELTPGASASGNVNAAPPPAAAPAAAQAPTPNPRRFDQEEMRKALGGAEVGSARPGASGAPRLLKPGQFAVNPGGTGAPTRPRPPVHAP
jgi:hypothetical protein